MGRRPRRPDHQRCVSWQLIGGLFKPVVYASLGAVWAVGRLIYAIGYRSGKWRMCPDSPQTIRLNDLISVPPLHPTPG
jgi:hypothetical protein